MSKTQTHTTSQQNAKLPLVSVVMPVYNAAEFLAEALKSLQKQTYKNWELIAVDDASTDASLQILHQFAKKDKRIRVYQNRHNLGVASTSNHALGHVQGQFIARMDSDDIACQERFALQVAFLQHHKNVIAVGGQCEVIDKMGRTIGHKNFPTQPKEVAKMLFTFASIQQPAMMVNAKKLPKDFVWYQPHLEATEEHELLFKFLQYGDLVNLNQTVLYYRMHGENISLKTPKRDFFFILRARISAVVRYGYKPTLSGVLQNITQFLIVALLPEKIVYELYTRLRGWKNVGHTETSVESEPLKLKKKLSSLSVFFPMHNEQENVARVITLAEKVLPHIARKYEIIIVNDGSTDATSEIAHHFERQSSKVRVIDQQNQGYGGALRTGFEAAKYEWIFFSDGDLQFDLSELQRFIPQTQNNLAVLGYRQKRADTLSRTFLAKSLKIWNRIFFQFPSDIKDIDCAFKLFHRSVVSTILPLESRGAMISTEIILKLLDKKYAFAQVGVTHYPRIYGSQTGARWNVILGAVKETIKLLYSRTFRSIQEKIPSSGYLPLPLPVLLFILVYSFIQPKQ